MLTVLDRPRAASDAAPDADLLAASLRRIAVRLHAFHADFAFLTDGAQADSIYWLEDGANPYKTMLRSVPCELEAFGDALRALFGAGLFLSPVLLAGHATERDARPFLRMAGLQASPDSGADAMPVRRLAATAGAAGASLPDTPPTVLPVTPAPAFIMAPFAPAPRPGEEMQAYARFLLEATHPVHDRGVLIFCPSQTAVRALHGAFRTVLGATDGAAADAPRVYAQWVDGNRDAITRLYAAGRGGFVIASEGLPGLRDDAGRAPAVWALTRMPLPPPRDPILEARGEPLREEGRNARGELWQPAAVLRVKREWSQQHRGPAPFQPPPPDTAGARAPEVIWLLDARASTEGLGARLAGALGASVEVAQTVDDLKTKTEAALET